MELVDVHQAWRVVILFFVFFFISVQENTTEKEKEKEQREDPAAKKTRVEYDSINDCVASNVIEISDQDELEVYGSDIRTSTQLTSYVFEVCTMS